MLLVLLTVLAIYFLALLGVAWLSLHPLRTPIFMSTAWFGAPQEEVGFDNGQGIGLRGWWLEAAGANTVCILAHGYLMNRAELAPIAARLWQEGRSCLLFEFRAHGKSGGKKCGLGWFERYDVRAAVAFARQKAPGAKIVLIGSSMGAAACALALGNDPSLADALVLDSAYSKLSKAISGWWRFLGGRVLALVMWPVTPLAAPLAGFNPYRVDVAGALRKAPNVPVLMIHGEDDDLAIPSEACRNQEVCNAKLVWMPKSGHTEGRWLHPDVYADEVLAFLSQHGL